jgi:enoyl-[acyl-carrier-protein] reductase (NADH)
VARRHRTEPDLDVLLRAGGGADDAGSRRRIAVIPGAVKTEAFMGYIGSEERLARYEGQIPLRRACRPEDIANAVLWLASDESACVTGIGLVVDGGVNASRAEPNVE